MLNPKIDAQLLINIRLLLNANYTLQQKNDYYWIAD